MTTDVTDDAELTGTIIAPDGLERRFRVGLEIGEIFAEDEDFDGVTLTIEVGSMEAGMALVHMIEARGRAAASLPSIQGAGAEADE